jgi:hypothetical protein
MEYLRIAVDLLKALAWPVLALYFLVVYREPLRAKLEQTTKVSVGSLVVEMMQTTLANIGDPALAKELPHLSRPAYEQLLSMQGKDDLRLFSSIEGLVVDGDEGIVLANTEKLAVARELTRMGLVESSEPLEGFIQFAEALPQEPSLIPNVGTWILEKSLSDTQYRRLTSHACRITPRGQKLYEVMIGVILSTLTKDTPADPHV